MHANLRRLSGINVGMVVEHTPQRRDNFIDILGITNRDPALNNPLIFGIHYDLADDFFIRDGDFLTVLTG